LDKLQRGLAALPPTRKFAAKFNILPF